MEKLINVTTRVNKELHKWLEDKAKADKRSIANVVLIAIENLKNQENKNGD